MRDERAYSNGTGEALVRSQAASVLSKNPRSKIGPRFLAREALGFLEVYECIVSSKDSSL